MDSKVDSEIKGAFSIYKNVDFKQSEGKKIHLIAMDKETLKSSTPYEGAEAIFHEMNAHIQNSTGDVGEDHKRYGKEGFGLYTRRGPIRDPLGNLVTDAKGQPLYENVPPNSPAGKIVRELKALQKDEEGN